MSRRLQGIAFLAVVIALIALSVARYSGAFADGVPVTLQTDRTGLQLDNRADVKVRGVIVGEVVDVRATGHAATVHLRLRPETVAQIPDNVHARLLPKTLFGEKYVALMVPAHPSGRALSAGDIISQDRSQAARELDAALDGLLPLLQAVAPQQLASTLGAVSTALDGRGRQLGDTLVRQQQLVSGLNTALPDLQADISGIADLAQTYSQAAPDLSAALADLATTSRTLAEQRQHLAALFDSVARASGDLRGFTAANGENIIALSTDSRPTLQSLARYAPEYPCLLGRLAGLVPKVDQAMGVGTSEPGLHVLAQVSGSRGKYLPGVDEPRYEEDRGPRCYPMPAGQRFPQYPPGGPLKDGSTPRKATVR
ncbi:MAG TPA: MCE family protein [Pseudonocardiaceae bacterium]|jgi:virulence factor Mce-like protein|nr:MCE family protein [Pseudonocardiaceae bacterium]